MSFDINFISKQISRAESEYMNNPAPPHPINALCSPLGGFNLTVCHWSRMKIIISYQSYVGIVLSNIRTLLYYSLLSVFCIFVLRKLQSNSIVSIETGTFPNSIQSMWVNHSDLKNVLRKILRAFVFCIYLLQQRASLK